MGVMCAYASLVGAGVQCGKFNKRCSLGVCGVCPDNTMKGIWPTVRKQTVVGDERREAKRKRDGSPSTRRRTPIIPIPREQWSWRVRVLAKMAKPEDKGVGDTVQRLLARMGGEWYKRFYKYAMGEECPCGDRAAKLNQRYPY